MKQYVLSLVWKRIGAQGHYAALAPLGQGASVPFTLSDSASANEQ